MKDEERVLVSFSRKEHRWLSDRLREMHTQAVNDSLRYAAIRVNSAEAEDIFRAAIKEVDEYREMEARVESSISNALEDKLDKIVKIMQEFESHRLSPEGCLNRIKKVLK